MDCPSMIPRRVPGALAALALLGCAAANPASAEDGLQVVASIKPVHSLVSTVMAGVGEPHLVIRGNASPHTFTMRPSDATALEDADVIFMIGDMMETGLVGPVEALAGHARVVNLFDTPGLVRWPLREGGAFEEHDHAGHDPQEQDDHRDDDHDDVHADDHGDHQDDEGGPFDMHVWLDPINGRTMARRIAGVLAEADPANADAYDANADALVQRLDRLSEEIAAQTAPARGVPFIVFHDGYRSFEERFGLTAAGSVVVSPQRPPGARRIAELRDKVQALGVACIFDEPQFDKRRVQAVIEGSDARSGTVDPLGTGIEDGPALYETLLRNMATSFTTCLAPDEGA